MATTLAALRDRVEVILNDGTNVKWATADIDEALRSALAAYSQVSPYHVIAALTLSTATREISLTTLTNLIAVLRVWWEYTAASPEYPANWREFEVWPGNILYVRDGDEPGAGDVVRVFYTTLHTLNGLDSATVTTIPDAHTAPLAQAAAGYAALTRAMSRTELLNIDGWVIKRMLDYANDQLGRFNAWLLRLARAEATQGVAIAPAPALDRWEGRGW